MAIRISIKKSPNRILIYSLIASRRRRKIRRERGRFPFRELVLDEICRVCFLFWQRIFSFTRSIWENFKTANTYESQKKILNISYRTKPVTSRSTNNKPKTKRLYRIRRSIPIKSCCCGVSAAADRRGRTGMALGQDRLRW